MKTFFPKWTRVIFLLTVASTLLFGMAAVARFLEFARSGVSDVGELYDYLELGLIMVAVLIIEWFYLVKRKWPLLEIRTVETPNGKEERFYLYPGQWKLLVFVSILLFILNYFSGRLPMDDFRIYLGGLLLFGVYLLLSIKGMKVKNNILTFLRMLEC